MSLTSAQKTKIVSYLGWPGKTLIEDSTNYNKTVADRLENLDAETEAQVAEILAALSSVETKFNESTTRMLVKKVGDIELNTDEHMYLNKEWRRLLRRLSNLLDIPNAGGGGMMIGLCV